MKLNQRQRAAVKYLDGPLLVLAGAGSGKTGVITHKIAYLIKECGILPNHVVAVTFTNKAAREMKARTTKLLGSKAARGLHISTFHTLGLKIVRTEIKTLGYKSGFSIFDSSDSFSLIKDLMRVEFGGDDSVSRQVQWQISNWKGALIDAETALRTAEDAISHSAASLYLRYQQHLKTFNAVDFDDLIFLPATLFSSYPDVLNKWQNRIRYLLVDEYQDTNASQYQLIKQLVGLRGALTVVGDDDQSIYAWRGARPENMKELKDDFSTLEVIKLEQNYRSSARILRAANQLISNNSHVFEKRLWSELGNGEPLRVLQARNDEDEAQRVVSEIISHKFKRRTSHSDYAILYRGNHQSRIFEKILRENNIPYFLSGGTSFFSYAEIRDLMAYLRLIVNNNDDAAFLRIINTPRREIGTSTVEKLASYAAERSISLLMASFELGLQQHISQRAYERLEQFGQWIIKLGDSGERGDPIAAVKELIRVTDYEIWLRDNSNTEKAAERRITNVFELVDWMERVYNKSEKDKTLSDLVAHMSLMDILDRNEEENTRDHVHLMTLHAAKGLEFPHVFIVGMEEELLPHRTSIEEGNIEEERRLAYVGLTRAQQSITFTLSRKRKRQGEFIECEPSRFLDELPEEDLSWEGHGVPVDPETRQLKGQAHLANLRSLLNTTE